jgi:hypothetical protein
VEHHRLLQDSLTWVSNNLIGAPNPNFTNTTLWEPFIRLIALYYLDDHKLVKHKCEECEVLWELVLKSLKKLCNQSNCNMSCKTKCARGIQGRRPHCEESIKKRHDDLNKCVGRVRVRDVDSLSFSVNKVWC